MTLLDRRALLTGISALLCAPAIVRASSLMPIRSLVPILWLDGIHDDTEALAAFNAFLPCKVSSSFRGIAHRSKDLILFKDADFCVPNGLEMETTHAARFDIYDCTVRNRSKLHEFTNEEIAANWHPLKIHGDAIS